MHPSITPFGLCLKEVLEGLWRVLERERGLGSSCLPPLLAVRCLLGAAAGPSWAFSFSHTLGDPSINWPVHPLSSLGSAFELRDPSTWSLSCTDPFAQVSEIRAYAFDSPGPEGRGGPPAPAVCVII